MTQLPVVLPSMDMDQAKSDVNSWKKKKMFVFFVLESDKNPTQFFKCIEQSRVSIF